MVLKIISSLFLFSFINAAADTVDINLILDKRDSIVGCTSGYMNSALKIDIPFIPHITIGSGVDLKAAKNLVDDLNSNDIDFTVIVDHFDIVKIVNPHSKRLL